MKRHDLALQQDYNLLCYHLQVYVCIEQLHICRWPCLSSWSSAAVRPHAVVAQRYSQPRATVARRYSGFVAHTQVAPASST